MMDYLLSYYITGLNLEQLELQLEHCCVFWQNTTQGYLMLMISSVRMAKILAVFGSTSENVSDCFCVLKPFSDYFRQT